MGYRVQQSATRINLPRPYSTLYMTPKQTVALKLFKSLFLNSLSSIVSLTQASTPSAKRSSREGAPLASSDTARYSCDRKEELFQPQLCETVNMSGPELNLVNAVPIALAQLTANQTCTTNVKIGLESDRQWHRARGSD